MFGGVLLGKLEVVLWDEVVEVVISSPDSNKSGARSTESVIILEERLDSFRVYECNKNIRSDKCIGFVKSYMETEKKKFGWTYTGMI